MDENKHSNKLKLFMDNFFIYGFGGLLLRALPFIMLPVITRLIPNTQDYGAVDIFSSITSLGVALAGFGMYDAAFRFFFDKDDIAYKKEVCSSAALISCMAAIVISIIYFSLPELLSLLFFSTGAYDYLITLAGFSILFTTICNNLAWPIRFENNRKLYLSVNMVSVIISYVFTILLLKNGFIITSIPLSGIAIALLSCMFYFIVNRKWYDLRHISVKLSKELIKFGLPLVPSFLIYWVFNSMDRIMIAHMLGPEYNGLYAAGSKLAMVSQLIQIAFSSGWAYFVFSTMKDKDQVETCSNIFQWLAAISFFLFALSLIVYKPIFLMLLTETYAQGYVVFPYLFLSPMLLVLFQTASSQLLVIKKSHIITISLFFGAASNVILNYFFIQWFGIKGCALATLIGYIVSVLMALIITSRQGLIIIKRRFIICSAITAALIAHTFFIDDAITIVLAVALMAVIAMLYMKDLRSFINNIKEKK